ncbi:MAG: hypothetical protein ACRDV8_06925 [Acidimicrobiales bacterium]
MDAEAYADMLPWLVFVVIDHKLGLGVAWAAGSSLACGVGLVAWSYWRGRYALLPRVAVGVFSVCLLAALMIPSWNDQVSLPRALVVVTLSVLAFGSLCVTPLSETYTVRLVAPVIRDDPRFRMVNVEMTLAWGIGAFAVALASSATALLPGKLAFTFLDWVTPLVLATVTILWAARRWEAFRLSVEAVPPDRRLGEGIAHVHAREGVARVDLAKGGVISFAARRSMPSLGLSSFELAEPAGDPELAGGRGRDAVIRHLPMRTRNAGSAGAD